MVLSQRDKFLSSVFNLIFTMKKLKNPKKTLTFVEKTSFSSLKGEDI